MRALSAPGRSWRAWNDREAPDRADPVRFDRMSWEAR